MRAASARADVSSPLLSRHASPHRRSVRQATSVNNALDFGDSQSFNSMIPDELKRMFHSLDLVGKDPHLADSAVNIRTAGSIRVPETPWRPPKSFSSRL